MDSYDVRIELRRGDHFKAANLNVNDEAIEAFAMIGQDALMEAITNVVTRMKIAIEEDEQSGREVSA